MTKLERAGIRAGRIDLATVWPVIADWWRTPVVDVEPQNDRTECLLSLAPAVRERDATIFAGSSPPELAGQDLMSLEFGREFVRRISPNSTFVLDGGAALSLWYAANASWERLRRSPGWIDMGVSTPNIDAFSDDQGPERLISWLETSALFEVAMREPTLALVFADDGPDGLVFAPRPTPG